MRAMKDSGVEWIGEIPAEWEISKMKYIGTYINGYAFKPSDWGDVGIPIIRIQDLTGTNNKPNYYNDMLPLKYLIKNGDILVSWAATLDAFIWNKEDAWLNQHIFKAINKEKVIIKKFFYWLIKEAMDNMNNDNKHGIVMQHVTANVFENYNVPLPPIIQQQRIADYLDKKCAEIDAIISKQHSIIEKLQEYKLSLITETVTKGLNADAEMKDSGIEWIGEIPKQWEVSRIKYICQFSPSCDISELDENSIVAYAPMECIKNGYFIEKYIKYGKLPKALTPFEDGDIVMAKVTPCFENGNISIMQNLNSKIGFGSSELFVFRAGKINKKFLFYWLQNSKFVEVAKSTMTGTGGLKRVSSKFVENSYICMPDFKAQKEIVDYLDNKCIKIEKIIIDKQKLISKLTEYKKSLIYEVVTGKKEV